MVSTENTGDDSGTVRRRAFIRATGAAGAVGAFAGCVGGGDDGDTGDGDTGDGGIGSGTIQIGAVDARTGTLSPFGERNERGFQLALDSINETGIGSNDAELDIQVEDSQSQPQSGVEAAQTLVDQEGVPLLIGAVGSGVSTAIHDSVIQGTDVVQISQNSTGAVLAESPDLLRMSPNGAGKGAELATKIRDDGYDELALTYVNNDYGVSLSEVVVEEFESMGGEVTASVAHEEEQNTYSGTVSELVDTGSEAVLFLTYAAEFTNMVNELVSRGVNDEIQFYGAESTIADEILENTPEGSHDGMIGITESAPVELDTYQRFESEFTEAYDVESPTVWAAYAYDAVMVSAIAIHVAGEVSGSAIGEVVREVTRSPGEEVTSLAEAKEVVDEGGDPDAIDYTGVSGPIDLDENGDPQGAYQVYRVEDHEYVFGEYIV